MQTPNDYLRALLIDLAEKHQLSDSAIARAHNRAYPDSRLGPSTVLRFRTAAQEMSGAAPTQLIEEAYAAATGTTREQNWEEAVRRWQAARRRGRSRASL